MEIRFAKTPIVPFRFRGTLFFVKRDDLLHPHLDGNKGRKFYKLLQLPSEKVEEVVSFGSPLANSLGALAFLARFKGWKLKYLVTYIPPELKREPVGNYLKALQLGAEVIETGLRGEELREYVLQMENKKGKRLIIEEGGRGSFAKEGVFRLGEEMLPFLLQHRLRVFLPSGTGTTAYFLSKKLAPLGIEVLTTPVVGGADYLKKQWEWLGGGDHLPTILLPPRRYRFGALYPNLYDLWGELKKGGIEFDLLYDPVGWETILSHNLKDILYIHQGGKIGNATMIRRYEKLKGKRG